MIALLTANQGFGQPTQTFRYMVELASNELDHEGIPLDIKTVDLLLSAPTRVTKTLDITGQTLTTCFYMGHTDLLTEGCPVMKACFSRGSDISCNSRSAVAQRLLAYELLVARRRVL